MGQVRINGQRWMAGVLGLWFVLAMAGADRAQAAEPATPAATPAAGMERRPGVITPDDLASAVERYIQRESEIQNGHFLFFDKDTNQPLALTFQSVKQDGIERVSETRYMAVAVMKNQSNQEVLLDIAMKYLGNDQLKVTEVSKHRDTGVQPEFVWDESQGNWKKR